MMMVALIGFFFALEKILPYRTRHGFTVAGAIVAVITVLAPREYLTALALSASLVVFGILVLFFTFFVRTYIRYSKAKYENDCCWIHHRICRILTSK